MPSPHLVQVSDLRQMRVEGVQQPEAGDVGYGKIREALVALAARAGQRRRFGGGALEDAVRDPHDERARRDVEQRRDERGIQRYLAGRGAHEADQWHRDIPFRRFAFEQESKVGPRDLDGAFREAGGLVARQLVLAAPARGRRGAARARIASDDVPCARSVFGYSDRHHQRTLILLPRGVQRSGRRRWVGGRRVEQEAVREASGGRAHHDRSASEGLAVDLEPRDTPRAERQRAKLEAQQFIEIPVLRLEVLRGEERPLAPEDEIERMTWRTRLPSVRPDARRRIGAGLTRVPPRVCEHRSAGLTATPRARILGGP